MKKWKQAFAALFLFSLLNVFYAEEKQGDYTLDLTVGNVEVSHDGGKKWKTAEVDSVLKESDMVRTGPGAYCEIGFPDDKGCFRLQEASLIELSGLGKETRVKLHSGKSIFDIFKPLFTDETLEVESETAIASVRGTQFFVESSKDSSVVSVEDGSVNVRRNIAVDVEKDLDSDFREAIQVNAQPGQEVEFGKKDNDEFASQFRKLRGNRAELRKFLAGQRELMKKRAMKMRDRQRVASMFREHRADLDKIKLRKKQAMQKRSQIRDNRADRKNKVKKAALNRKKVLRENRNR